MSSTADSLYLRRRIGNVIAIAMSCATALFGLFFLGFLLLIGLAVLVDNAMTGP